MKKQTNNSHRAIIALTFLASLLTITACREKKELTNNTIATQAKVKPPKIDIHTAVMTGNIEALKQHIAAGSDLNEKDPFGGSSPLISACLFGKSDIAKMLIEAGADLNFRNNDGSTALYTASFFCHPDIVRMLLDKGADKTIKNKYGSTAYESVSAPFADVKTTYDGLGKMLAPIGVQMDYAYLEKTRPVVAAMLK